MAPPLVFFWTLTIWTFTIRVSIQEQAGEKNHPGPRPLPEEAKSSGPPESITR